MDYLLLSSDKDEILRKNLKKKYLYIRKKTFISHTDKIVIHSL